MGNFFSVLLKKPPFIVIISLLYFLTVGLAKWWINPPLGAVWFIVGGVIGTYFLDVAEYFFKLSPSPFRSVVFEALFVAVSFFIITSSGGWLEGGLVLAIYLSMLASEIAEWRTSGNLNTWFQMITVTVSSKIQQFILVGFALIFILETYLFIR